MKNIFLVTLFLFNLFLAWVSFNYYAVVEENTFSGGKHTLVYIQIAPGKDKDAAKKLSALAEEHNVHIERRTYDYINQEMSVYTTNLEAYAGMLETGSLPYNPAEYVCTEPKALQSSMQTGKLYRFNLPYQVKLYSLMSYVPATLSGEYQIGITDTDQVERFCEAIRAVDGGESFAVNIHRTVTDNTEPISIVIRNIEFIFLFLIMLVLIASFQMFREMKTIMMKKMLGYSNFKLICTQVGRIGFNCVISLSCSLIVTTAALLFLGKKSGMLKFLLSYLSWCGIFIGIIISILLCLIIILVIIPKAQDYMKNKQPYGIMVGLSLICKLPAILILFGAITLLPGLISTAQSHQSVQAQWEALKTYANLPVYEERSNTHEELYILGEKHRKFFELENNRGGILMAPAANLAYAIGLGYSSPDEPYFLVNNTVTVNNNYLQLNPIYDLNGDQINLANEYEDVLIVLMPEKYRGYEQQFEKELLEFANMTYYIQEDVYLEEIGEKTQEHTDRQIRLIYVKNDQYYFSCNPDYGTMQNHYFQDPICIVANNVNVGGDTYLSGFSCGDFKAKIPNEATDISYFKEHIIAADLESSALVAENAYGSASDTIYKTQKYLTQQITISVLYIAVFLALCFIFAALLVNIQKETIYVKYLLGYSPLKINKLIYFCSVVYYALFAVLCRALGAEFTAIQVILLISYLVIELSLITLATIFMVQQRQTKKQNY